MNATTTTQHTPGPWHVEKSLGRYEIWPKDSGQTHSFVGVVQRELDARLIAAAPELLSTLQSVSDYFAKIDEMQPARDHGQVGEAIRAAVKFAIGSATTTGKPIAGGQP